MPGQIGAKVGGKGSRCVPMTLSARASKPTLTNHSYPYRRPYLPEDLMPDTTPILSLPLLLPSQAQKHVTHNEALRLLDVAVQLSVLDRSRTAPPASPQNGDCHIIAAASTGDWAGQSGKIAAWWDEVWLFMAPKTGWSAWVIDETRAVVFRDGVWADTSDLAARFDQLGVNVDADAVNRLSVQSAATLLNHNGAGHQLKLNKATATDTASLLFQTGFSGRAEIGLAGSDDLSVKVSADGVTFTDAAAINGATGRVSLPAGATVTGTLTGTAVTQSVTDTTADRLLKVGDFGLGGTAPNVPASINTSPELIAPGSYNYSTSFSAGGPSQVLNGTLMHLRRVGGIYAQMIIGDWGPAALGHIFTRAFVGGSWSDWRRVYSDGNLLGTVSQTAGVPTGAVIERGTNANGDYTRFADGTQICTRATLSAANANTALGSLFRSSANITWSFPAAFSVAPTVTVDCTDADSWATCAAAPATTSVSIRALSAVTKSGALAIRAMAIGRWF